MSLVIFLVVCTAILAVFGAVFFFEWLYNEYIIWAFEG